MMPFFLTRKLQVMLSLHLVWMTLHEQIKISIEQGNLALVTLNTMFNVPIPDYFSPLLAPLTL